MAPSRVSPGVSPKAGSSISLIGKKTAGFVNRPFVTELVSVPVLPLYTKVGEVLGHRLQKSVALRLSDDAADVAVDSKAALVVDLKIVLPVLSPSCAMAAAAKVE